MRSQVVGENGREVGDEQFMYRLCPGTIYPAKSVPPLHLTKPETWNPEPGTRNPELET